MRLPLPTLAPALLALLATACPHGALPQETPVRPREASAHGTRPTRLFEVVRVVDGDTIHIERDGRLEKLRLLSVDTEEKITGRPALSDTKPETVYGQESADWAKAFFEDLAGEGAAPRVGLRFPGDVEARDVYGRLLCHVILPDGRDFNLLLVELGRSPYFNKYGNSLICHDEFVRAQERARAEELGIWNPETNRARTPGAPEARRPYERLLPWWNARAEAVERFRREAAEAPEPLVAADDPAALAEAFALAREDPGLRVTVFAEIDRTFDETDGSLTVLLRTGDKDNAVRVPVPADARAERGPFLDGLREEFRQNYLRVDGRLVRGPRGYRLEHPSGWRLAGPEVPR